MKNRFIFISIITIILMTTIFTTVAFAKIENGYTFHIKSNSILNTSRLEVLLPYTTDEKTLINGKIAPGTSGSFNINIELEKDIEALYNITFSNFSINFPKNLKFYYLDKEIDISNFEIKETKASENKTYEIKWVWDYETENGDKIDTLSGINLDCNFDIVVDAEISNLNNNTLPRTGDIASNF